MNYGNPRRWRRGAVIAIALPFASLTPFAQQLQSAGERLSDKDVKAIMQSVDQKRDRFEDQLDGNLKRSILRAPTGEVSVERYLDDFQDNIKKMQERFTPEYSASKEVETVLKQGTAIHTYIKSQPAELKGGSEWDSVALTLNQLAAVYRTSFPLPSDAAVRRINDGEAAATADELAKNANRLKKQLDQEKSLAKPDRDTAKRNLDALANAAKLVKSRVSGSQPATAEMRQLLNMATPVSAFMQGQSSLLPGTTSAWNALRGPLEKLQQAYGVRPPSPQP